MIKSCYIHIPFCQTICSYCDFCKMFYHKKMVSDYLECLEKEIKNIYQKEILDTIYIGGGTPSCLDYDELERLFKILEKLNKSQKIEYTIEGNFESTNQEKLELYKKYGINRLSFGLESIDSNNLELLERSISKTKVSQIIKQARKIGFHNINVDLIYALPKETYEVLKKDLDFLFALNIEHISTYSLMIEEHTKLWIKNIKAINTEKDAKMYQLICKEMKKHAYNHYEISNFAKEGYESKHNLTYWNNEEYYGFGLGASSYRKNSRVTNTKSIQQYQKGLYSREIEIVNTKEKIEYEVILNLRKKTGIDLELFKNKYNKTFSDIYSYQNLIEQKLLCEGKNHLFIPEEKWYISNEIIVRLLGCEKNE